MRGFKFFFNRFQRVEIWLQNGVKETTTNDQKQRLVDLEGELESLRNQNQHLKEEYEKYKIRTNYLIKSAKQHQQQQNITPANKVA